MVERTIVETSSLPTMREMNERSIFSSCTGSSHDVGERGVARAVVVDGELQAELGEPVEHLLRVRRVVHEAALGDLEAESFAARRARRAAPETMSGSSRFMRSRAEMFTRDLQPQALAQPLAALADGFAQHPAREHLDVARVLGERNEQRGAHQRRVRGCSQRSSASTELTFAEVSETFGW